MPATRLEVLSGDFRLVGEASTEGRRFSTWLNLGETRTTTMDHVALRSMVETQRSQPGLRQMLVNRDAVVAAILGEESGKQVAGAGRKSLECVDQERHEVVVSAPPFALKSHSYLAGGADLHRALDSPPGSFIPVIQARIIY